MLFKKNKYSSILSKSKDCPIPLVANIPSPSTNTTDSLTSLYLYEIKIKL